MKMIALYQKGNVPADSMWVSGSNREEVLENAKQQSLTGYHLSQLIAKDRYTTVWRENEGWVE